MNFKFQISNFKLDWKIILFIFAIASGVFLRVWNFSDWLYFKRDEARDAFVILKAYASGPGWLPLLGPNATGAHYFTGPIYYYFQYLAALFFRNPSPAVLAFPDLFFSLLTLPLFYYFLKKYFSRYWSMILAALFAVNFFAIEYSRFAWNPNSLPFFNLLYFFALLNIFDEKQKRPLLWPAVAGFSLAVATQLHVISLFSLPAITVVFFASKFRDLKKHVSWKKAAVFFAFVVVTYAPIIINEIMRHGRNTKGLLSAINREPYYSSLAANMFADALGIGQYWFLILTGYISAETEVWTMVVAWLAVIVPGLFLLAIAWRKGEEGNRKNFVAVILFCFFGYAAVYLPVAAHMQARFLLPMEFVPIIFLGVILECLWKKNKILLKIAVLAIILVAFIGNIAGTFLWFKEIKAAQDGLTKSKRTIILKEKDGIVLWHLQAAAKYMNDNCEKGPIYYYTNFEYGTPLKYVFELEGTRALPLDAYTKEKPGCIFLFDPSQSGKGDLSKRKMQTFNFLGQKDFGILKMYKIAFKDNSDVASFTRVQKEKKSEYIYWRNVFPWKEK